MNTEKNLNDYLSFKDKHEKHGLRGHVQIFRENTETKEKTLWYEDDNIIPISGYQWILMKMFGLYLDSSHKKKYEVIDQDSTIAIPDLNSDAGFNIGKPISGYTEMKEDISADHFVQGFMIGNGGAGEDGVTTKNTDYSFVRLRHPIPFQQTNMEGLNADIAGSYLGVRNISESSDNNPYSKSYYIKKFDERPHIYHSFWREGQKWDYVDPVTTNDLGPNATTSVTSNRIESYVECKLSLSDDDCVAYFGHAGSNQTAMINELGLVAFDVDAGARSTLEAIHDTDIQQLINFIFDNNRSEDTIPETIRLASELVDVFNNIKVSSTETKTLKSFGNVNINAFIDTITELSGETVETLSADDSTRFKYYQDQLALSENIQVEAFYNQNGSYIYSTDKFKEYLSSSDFDSLGTDEAQRIKLITYYTFNSIPLQKNWRILINYRIYAN